MRSTTQKQLPVKYVLFAHKGTYPDTWQIPYPKSQGALVIPIYESQNSQEQRASALILKWDTAWHTPLNPI